MFRACATCVPARRFGGCCAAHKRGLSPLRPPHPRAHHTESIPNHKPFCKRYVLFRYKLFLAALYESVSEVAARKRASGARKKKRATTLRRWRRVKRVVSMQQQGSEDRADAATDDDDDDDDDERALFAPRQSSVTSPSPTVCTLGGDQDVASAASSDETTCTNAGSADDAGVAAASVDRGDRGGSTASPGGGPAKGSDGRDVEYGGVAAGGGSHGGASMSLAFAFEGAALAPSATSPSSVVFPLGSNQGAAGGAAFGETTSASAGSVDDAGGSTGSSSTGRAGGGPGRTSEQAIAMSEDAATVKLQAIEQGRRPHMKRLRRASTGIIAVLRIRATIADLHRQRAEKAHTQGTGWNALRARMAADGKDACETDPDFDESDAEVR